jgi:hypothetical protein
MLMVLAVTRRMVKITARPMPFRSRARFPESDTKLARKAASVSVLVRLSLFLKRASMSLLTAPARLGSSMDSMKVPTWTAAAPRVASSRYFQWNSMVCPLRCRAGSTR